MRSKILLLLLVLFFSISNAANTPTPLSTLDKMILLIKRYEGWHSAKHWPVVGWGHQVQPGENLHPNITVAQADSILYEDLHRFVTHFKSYGKDCPLLALLAYNVGYVPIEGNKTHPPSQLLQKIRSGNRDFKDDYLGFCKWKGKVVPSIQHRRYAEFLTLYEE